MKTCNVCGEMKDSIFFPKGKRTCKKCRKLERKRGKILLISTRPVVINNVPSIAEAFNGWKI